MPWARPSPAAWPARSAPHGSCSPSPATAWGHGRSVRAPSGTGGRRRPFDVFLALGTANTLILLVGYVLATLGAVRLLFFTGRVQVNRREIVIPVPSLAALGSTLFRNLWPLPSGSTWWGPRIALAWLVAFLAAPHERTRRASDRRVPDPRDRGRPSR